MRTIDAFFHAMSLACEEFDRWTGSFWPNAFVDHIGFKCSSREEFTFLRDMLDPVRRFRYESTISGRTIAIIAFERDAPAMPKGWKRTPGHTLLGMVNYLELSDQKPDGSQRSGFDHFEIVSRAGTPEMMATHLSKIDSRYQFFPSGRAHHPTYDMRIPGSGLKIRIEPEPLIEKIRREEMT